jgi:predicted GIY-YIG superfamily endonuclease
VKNLARLSARLGGEVVYIGATNDLERRVLEHQRGLFEGFTKKY